MEDNIFVVTVNKDGVPTTNYYNEEDYNTKIKPELDTNKEDYSSVGLRSTTADGISDDGKYLITVGAGDNIQRKPYTGKELKEGKLARMQSQFSDLRIHEIDGDFSYKDGQFHAAKKEAEAQPVTIGQGNTFYDRLADIRARREASNKDTDGQSIFDTDAGFYEEIMGVVEEGGKELEKRQKALDPLTKELKNEYAALEKDGAELDAKIKAFEERNEKGLATQEELDALNAEIKVFQDRQTAFNEKHKGYEGQWNELAAFSAFLTDTEKGTKKDYAELLSSSNEMSTLMTQLNNLNDQISVISGAKKRAEDAKDKKAIEQSERNLKELIKQRDEVYEKLSSNKAYRYYSDNYVEVVDGYDSKGNELTHMEKLPDVVARTNRYNREQFEGYQKELAEINRNIRQYELASGNAQVDQASYDFYVANKDNYQKWLKRKEELSGYMAKNPIYKQEQKRLTSTADSLLEEAFPHFTVDTRIHGVRYTDPDVTVWSGVQHLAHAAKKAVNAPDDTQNGFMAFLKGHGDTFTSEDFWSFGLTSMVDNFKVKGIFDKIQGKLNTYSDEDLAKAINSGKLDEILTEPEIALLKAFVTASEAQALRAENTANMYNAGRTSAESLGFMAQFILSGGVVKAGASAAAKSAAVKAMENWIAKQTGKVAGSQVARAITRGSLKLIGKDATKLVSKGIAAMTNAIVTPLAKAIPMTILQTGVYKDYSTKLVERDEFGNLKYDRTSALLPAIRDAGLEVWSEMALEPVLEVFGKSFGKIFDMALAGKGGLRTQILATKLNDLYTMFHNREAMALLVQGGWDGYLEEIGEELLGAAVSSIWDPDAMKEFWKKDNLISMAVAFAPMSILGGGMSMANFAKRSKKFEEVKPRMRELLQPLVENGTYTEEQLEGLFDRESQTLGDIAENINEIVQPLVENGEMTEDIFHTLLEFADAKAQQEVGKVLRARYEQEQRLAVRNLIEQSVGNKSFISKDKEGNEFVNTYQDKDGNTRYVIIDGDGSGQCLSFDMNGQNPDFVIPGDVEVKRQTADEYCEEWLKNSKTQKEAQRMQQEKAEQKNEVASALQNGQTISLTNSETGEKEDYIFMGWNGDQLMVGKDANHIEARSIDEVANALGIDKQVLTDAQKQNVQIEQSEANDKKASEANEYKGARYDVKGNTGTLIRVQSKMDEEGNSSLVAWLGTPEGLVKTEVTSEELDEFIARRKELENGSRKDRRRDARLTAKEQRAYEAKVKAQFDAVKTKYTNADGSVRVDEWLAEDPETFAQYSDQKYNKDYTDKTLGANLVKQQAAVQAAQAAMDAETVPSKKDVLMQERDKALAKLEVLTNLVAQRNVDETMAGELDEEAAKAKIADLQSKGLNEQEIVELAAKAKAEAEQALASIQKPEVSTDIEAYMQEKKAYAEAVAAAQKKVAYWNSILATPMSSEAQLTENAKALQKWARNASAARMAQFKREMKEGLDAIAITPYEIVTLENVEEIAARDNIDAENMAKLHNMVEKFKRFNALTGSRCSIDGFHYNGKAYIFADGNATLGAAQRTLSHETQHNLNAMSGNTIIADVIAAFKGDRKALLQAVNTMSGSNYSFETTKGLADELIAFTMEGARLGENPVEKAMKAGMPQEFIDIIQKEYDRQTSNNLSQRSEIRDAHEGISGTTGSQLNGETLEGESGNEQLGSPRDGNGSVDEEGSLDFRISAKSEAKPKEIEELFEGKEGVALQGSEVIAINEGNGIRFSVRTWEDGGREALATYLDKQIKKGKVNKDDASNLLAEMDRLTSMAKDLADGKPNGLFGQWAYELVRTKDGTSIPVLHALKKNSEYELNIDFSTVCKKRQVIDHIFNKMIRDGYLLDENLSDSDIARMNQIIQKHGLEIACGICFVDSKRYNAYIFANGFLDKYNTIVASLVRGKNFGNWTEAVDSVAGYNYADNKEFSNEGKLDLSQITEVVDWENMFDANGNPVGLNNYMLDWSGVVKMFTAPRQDSEGKPKPSVYEVAMAEKMEKPEKSFTDCLFSALGGSAEKMAFAMSLNPALRKLAKAEDFIASEGWTNILAQNEALEKLWNIQKGAAGARPNEDNTQYQNEVLEKGINGDIFDIGGYRMQSFSDFIGRMYFDYLQAFADLSAMGLPGHAYTKEPNFVKLFGYMGMKVNMSLVSDVDRRVVEQFGKDYAGLTIDANGNLTYNFYVTIRDAEGNILRQGQTFPPEEAFALQADPRYSKTAGTIAVGLSRQHILMMLRDRNIRMVIPYHKSGLPHGVALIYSLEEVNDYTKTQNTRGKKTLSTDQKKTMKKRVDNYNFTLHQLSIAEDKLAAYNALRLLQVKGLSKEYGDASKVDIHEAYNNLYNAIRNGEITEGLQQREFSERWDSMDFLPKVAADIYIEACESWNYIPKFDEFANEQGYYKTLIDFSVYDSEGNYTPQEAIHFEVPENFKELVKEALAEDESIVAKEAEETEPVIEEIEKYLQQTDLRAEQNRIASKAKPNANDKAIMQTNIYNIGDQRNFTEAEEGESVLNIVNGKPVLRGLAFRVQEAEDAEVMKAIDFINGKEVEINPTDENGVRFRVVTDQATIDWLESSEKITGYRNVVLNEDGTFGSPMASSLKNTGKERVKTSSFEQDKWEEAEENLDLVDEKGKITLVKPDGKTVDKVDYNPYIHNRPDKVNKQFKQAWERPALVYIETEIAKADLDEGYHAEKAKKSVGVHNWPSKTSKEKLILSRYDKPVRIVPWDEVADDWEKKFKKSGVHFDIVPPALLPILDARGVKILAPHKGMGDECFAAYDNYKNTKNERRSSISFRISEARKQTMASQMTNKLSFMTQEQINNTIATIEKLGEESKKGGDSKMENSLLDWVCRGMIVLPDDQEKAVLAYNYAKRFNKNTASITNINSFVELMSTEVQKREADKKPLDPDTVPEFTNKTIVSEAHGIVVYDVPDSKEGQRAVRRVVDSHFGYSANPWCLISRLGDGDTLKSAWGYWKNYSAAGRKIAFQNGKLIAFMSSSSKREQWWDRLDRAHEKVPVMIKFTTEDGNKVTAQTKVSASDTDELIYDNIYTISRGNVEETFDASGNIVNTKYSTTRDGAKESVTIDYTRMGGRLEYPIEQVKKGDMTIAAEVKLNKVFSETKKTSDGEVTIQYDTYGGELIITSLRYTNNEGDKMARFVFRNGALKPDTQFSTDLGDVYNIVGMDYDEFTNAVNEISLQPSKSKRADVLRYQENDAIAEYADSREKAVERVTFHNDASNTSDKVTAKVIEGNIRLDGNGSNLVIDRQTGEVIAGDEALKPYADRVRGIIERAMAYEPRIADEVHASEKVSNDVIRQEVDDTNERVLSSEKKTQRAISLLDKIVNALSNAKKRNNPQGSMMQSQMTDDILWMARNAREDSEEIKAESKTRMQAWAEMYRELDDAMLGVLNGNDYFDEEDQTATLHFNPQYLAYVQRNATDRRVRYIAHLLDEYLYAQMDNPLGSAAEGVYDYLRSEDEEWALDVASLRDKYLHYYDLVERQTELGEDIDEGEVDAAERDAYEAILDTALAFADKVEADREKPKRTITKNLRTLGRFVEHMEDESPSEMERIAEELGVRGMRFGFHNEFYYPREVVRNLNSSSNPTERTIGAIYRELAMASRTRYAEAIKKVMTEEVASTSVLGGIYTYGELVDQAIENTRLLGEVMGNNAPQEDIDRQRTIREEQLDELITASKEILREFTGLNESEKKEVATQPARQFSERRNRIWEFWKKVADAHHWGEIETAMMEHRDLLDELRYEDFRELSFNVMDDEELVKEDPALAEYIALYNFIDDPDDLWERAEYDGNQVLEFMDNIAAIDPTLYNEVRTDVEMGGINEDGYEFSDEEFMADINDIIARRYEELRIQIDASNSGSATASAEVGKQANQYALLMQSKSRNLSEEEIKALIGAEAWDDAVMEAGVVGEGYVTIDNELAYHIMKNYNDEFADAVFVNSMLGTESLQELTIANIIDIIDDRALSSENEELKKICEEQDDMLRNLMDSEDFPDNIDDEVMLAPFKKYVDDKFAAQDVNIPVQNSDMQKVAHNLASILQPKLAKLHDPVTTKIYNDFRSDNNADAFADGLIKHYEDIKSKPWEEAIRFRATYDVQQQFAPRFTEIKEEYEQKKAAILGHEGRMTPAEWKEHRDELMRIGKERDERLKPLQEEYQRAYEEAEAKDIADAPKYDKVGTADAERGKALFDAAKEQFGTTTDFNEAGYIVPDGDMIDLSGKNDGGEAGRRQNDHRDIGSVITDRKYETATEYMDDFINEGAIRIAPEQGLVTLANKPTKEQREKLRDYLYKHNNEAVDVELYKDGKSEASPTYRERTSPTKVLNDINAFYDEGVVPTGTLRFRTKEEEEVARAIAFVNGEEFEESGDIRFRIPYKYDVTDYDLKNGTELQRFLDFINRGKILNPGESRFFTIGTTGPILNKFGIKGKITIGSSAFNERHTKDVDHNLGEKEWKKIVIAINDPLYIISYSLRGKAYRVYTPIQQGNKVIVVGVDVLSVGRNVEISNISTAFGRKASKVQSTGETILYNRRRDKKRIIAELSLSPNPKVYLQSSVSSADKDTNNSETSNTESTIRPRVVSKEMDAEYLDAVNAGDMQKAQQMVNEAAKKAGYIVNAFHGTPNGGFYVFSPEDADSQFGDYKFPGYNVTYFSSSEVSAKTFAGWREGKQLYNVMLKLDNPYVVNNVSTANTKSSFNIMDETLREFELKKFDEFFYNWNGRDIYRDDLEDLRKALFPFNMEVREIGNDEYEIIRLGNNSMFGSDRPIARFELGEPIEEDLMQDIEDNVKGEDENDYIYSTDRIVRLVLAMNEEGTNYDGIVIKDILDAADWGGEIADDYITFNSNQIKSADPVTRDDEGNVIPLSERFNEESNDIRFRISDIRRKGIAEAMGEEKFRDYTMDIYNTLPQSLKDEVNNEAMANGGNFTQAVVRTFAVLAEKDELSQEELEAVKEAADKLTALAEAKTPYEANDILWFMYDEQTKNAPGLYNRIHSQEVKRNLGQKKTAVPGMSTIDFLMRAAGDKSDIQAQYEAMDALVEEMNTITAAMAERRTYDRATVGMITKLGQDVLESGLLDNMTAGEVKRLLGIVRRTTSMRNVQNEVNKLYGLILGNHLRNVKNLFEKELKRKATKVNSKNVVEQSALDVDGQSIMSMLKDYKDDISSTPAPDGTVNYGVGAGLLAEMQKRLDIMSDTEATEEQKHKAETEYIGLSLAKQYIENVGISEKEEAEIKSAMKEADRAYENGQMGKKEHSELMKELHKALVDCRSERAEGFAPFVQTVQDITAASHTLALDFARKNIERIQEIHHNANSDMQGIDPKVTIEPKGAFGRFYENIGKFPFLSLPTFDQMLRLFGRKSVNGEGYLWNRFMRGWVDAAGKEFTETQKEFEILDAKVSEVFGKKMRWSDLYRIEAGMPTRTAYFFNGGKDKEPFELTQGQLLYILLADQMTDGRMKLRKMGITEEDVESIRKEIDPRFLALADWVVNEYFPRTREKYNAVHERMFGAPMSKVSNYFPLKVNKHAIRQQKDVSQATVDPAAASTVTGSIMKRSVNVYPLDIMNADAFSMVIDHVQKMEHWAAFAEWNRDLSDLLSYNNFVNAVRNMGKTIYGSKDELMRMFEKVCRVTAGSYAPDKSDIDRAALAVGSGVTAAKISARIWTAFKQLTSFPAYLSEVYNPVYFAEGAVKGWSWAMENLPLFEKRWKSRQLGDHILKASQGDVSKLQETLSRYGMSLNAVVDAYTVCMGAYAMYKTKLKKYLDMGFSQEEADKKAKQDATILYNETQQSNEAAFLSPVQSDRGLTSTVLTIFRNSSMGYTRQEFDALRNLMRKLKPGYKDESVSFMTKQLEREGLNSTDAFRGAKSVYQRQTVKDLLRLAIFGYGLPFFWNLSAVLPYLFFGDDDDKKKRLLEDVAKKSVFGPLEGFVAGNVMSEAANMLFFEKKGFRNYDPTLFPLFSDVKNLMNKWNRDEVAAVNDVVNLAVQCFTGVNPQTFTDMAVAIIDACNGDLETAKEAEILFLRLMNAPQSSIDQLYIDELEMSALEAKNLTVPELAERYAKYKMRKGAGILTFLYDDMNKKKIIDKYVKSLEDKTSNRIQENWSTKQYLQLSDEAKTMEDRVKELRTLARNGDMDAEKELLDIFSDPRTGTLFRFSEMNKEVSNEVNQAVEALTTEEMMLHFNNANLRREAIARQFEGDPTTETFFLDKYSQYTKGVLPEMARVAKQYEEDFIANNPDYEKWTEDHKAELEKAEAEEQSYAEKIGKIDEQLKKLVKVMPNGKKKYLNPPERKRLNEQKKALQAERKAKREYISNLKKDKGYTPEDYIPEEIYNTPEFQMYLEMKSMGTASSTGFKFKEIAELEKKLKEAEDAETRAKYRDLIQHKMVQLGQDMTRLVNGVDDDDDFYIPEDEE